MEPGCFSDSTLAIPTGAPVESCRSSVPAGRKEFGPQFLQVSRGAILFLVVALASFAAPAPVTAQPLLERQYLTGDWNGIRPLLSTHGFEPYLVYTGSTWSNVAGGRATGVRINGYLNFGMDLDLARLGAWNGSGLHVDFHWWQGGEPTKALIGGLPAMALSGWEAADTFRVYNIYLRQAVDDDRVVVKLGQIAADTDFMVSRYGGVFLNAAFGDLPSQNLNIDAPVYPLAAAGAFAAVRPWRWLTTRFGAYTGDPGDDVAGNHGFEWKLGSNAGYSFFSEIGVAPTGCRLPATYTLGSLYDTGGSDQFGTAAERRAHYELYLMADQALTVDASGEPALGAFARISGSPQDARNVVGLYADAGWRGSARWRYARGTCSAPPSPSCASPRISNGTTKPPARPSAMDKRSSRSPTRLRSRRGWSCSPTCSASSPRPLAARTPKASAPTSSRSSDAE